jgi:ubiquinone/menaquinone biosynthesis C-methylase UbiE
VGYLIYDMKVSYVGNSEQEGAKFWLKRVGWEPSEAARKIAQESSPATTSFIADIGGGHGRETLWLAEQGFSSLLVEPNRYSLEIAREATKNRKLNVILINAALPFLPICSQSVDIIDFYWTLHQLPDELKLISLKEIYRILKPNGTLYSTSFGFWEGYSMPPSIYPIVSKQNFLNFHVSAGFKPRGTIEERSDRARSYEHFWYGIFKKIP